MLATSKLTIFLVLFYASIITLAVVFGPSRIGQEFYHVAHLLQQSRFGWLVVALVMIITSLPPMIFFSTSLTMCGFVWHMKGFFLAAPAAIAGAAFSFLMLRLLFKNRLKLWAAKSERWKAFDEVIRAKGLPLIILIRSCPIPWVYSNAFFASVEAVSLQQFLFATVFLFPRILLAVFVGSRLADLADGDTRGKMDSTTKILNALSIALAILIAFLTGVYVYRVTQAKIRSMESERNQPANAEANVSDLETPLLQNGPESELASASHSGSYGPG